MPGQPESQPTSVPDPLSIDGFADRYQLGAVLGEGGMGEVKVCKDVRIGREIAIKTIRPGHGSRSDLHARFLREARVQGQLEHPAIVPVYDLGRDPSGAAYFTMKRLRGMTFEQILQKLRDDDAETRKQFSRRKLLTAFASVCMAIDFAHSRGVLHRDIKPANVMLGDFGEVYLLDWGLAKLASHDEGDDARYAPPKGSGPQPVVAEGGSDPARTVVGAAMGTPGYMAPEQVRGGTLDARTDVYGLGALLFEILALESLQPRGLDVEETLRAAEKGCEARFSIRVPELDVPPELEAVVFKATARAPEDRFRTARELSDAVESYLDGDRDHERRRALAHEHARAAAGVAARPTLSLDDRRRAMRDVSRALALDPENGEAVAALARLLTEPPAEPPKEALDEVDASRRVTARSMSWTALGTYLAFFVCLPFVAAMGAREPWLLALLVPVWLAAAVVSFVALRNPTRNARISYVSLVVGSAAIALTSVFFGPYLVVPSLAAVHAAAFLMSPSREGRVAVCVLSCLSVLVPAALDWAGLVPTFYSFGGDAFTVLPHFLRFPAVATQGLLVVASVVPIITACVIVGRSRETLSQAEERIHVQAWLLRQLVPGASPMSVRQPARAKSRA
jgi:serine/threonine-protein kinase